MREKQTRRQGSSIYTWTDAYFDGYADYNGEQEDWEDWNEIGEEENTYDGYSVEELNDTYDDELIKLKNNTYEKMEIK